MTLSPADLLQQNRAWAARIERERPTLFETLSDGQAPEYLWIGCSDSRVPASQIVDGAPGDLFVHRNIANRVDHTDVNGLSVLQYAVEVLQVAHVIVCGHYGCGGVRAAMDGAPRGSIDHWLSPIEALYRRHADALYGLDEQARWDRLCELNVGEQVDNLADSTVVERAWSRGQSLTIHGWIYRLETGCIHDLGIQIDGGTDG